MEKITYIFFPYPGSAHFYSFTSIYVNGTIFLSSTSITMDYSANHRGRKLKILTWNVHGSYLYYLSQGGYELCIPVKEKKEDGYYGRGKTFPFGENVIEIPVEDVKDAALDCILFQSRKNYLVDQFKILNEQQRSLPRIYLEHNPPGKNPTDQLHIMQDPQVLMVHVTHYNKLMWQNENSAVKVIEHGVLQPKELYEGKLRKGIVIVNNLNERGRKAGADIFREVNKHIPLDLIGIGTKEYDGLGEVLHPRLPAFISQYRFFFNPTRYTSLALGLCEAMMIGMPVVSLATTGYSSVIANEVSGIIHTDLEYLIEKMKALLNDHSLAISLGTEAKKTAERKFNIRRFTNEWEETFRIAIRLKTKKYGKETNSVHK